MQKVARELQLNDTTLTPYLEKHKLPTSETESQRIVLECEKLEVIDGILHHGLESVVCGGSMQVIYLSCC